ncbi:MAG: c-type cytochrome [Gemmataceae bacterium]|nr:c-type cytochrome [Gemmataceae bacterium]
MTRSLRCSLPLALTAAVAAAAAALLPGTPAAQPPAPAKPYNPKIHADNGDALKALKRLHVPQGHRIELIAAEPLLANPVAFCIDEKGRFYVAETFRLGAGVTDNRSHSYWLNDDLAARTVADRVAMYRKHLKDRFDTYAVEHDRVRLLEDTNGDGKLDRATVFADGFNRPEDGIGSGLLARGGTVWYTCIPDLWLLRDANGDGKADVKKSLHTGYGVHVAFIGHDLHGLVLGPDGRLYFSVGDRGLHVEAGGRTLSNPDSGAVLRCNPDGSELEIIATGLRNPQELAFDQYGNLFTGDNNADGGDQARWVYVVEGGDSGWRIGYQYLEFPTRLGAWNAERLWHLPSADPAKGNQAAYLLPPLAHIGSGPSGLTYHPGVTLLDEKYKEHFFLSDFRGSSGGSSINSFKVRPRGASFEVTDQAKFVSSVLATDCDFGPDGGFYLTDWVEGWGKPNRGRIYKVSDPGRAGDKLVGEVKRLLAEGMGKRPAAELGRLLEHPDMRVRLEAQLALVEAQGGDKLLAHAARAGKSLPARLHGLWGLGQLARRSSAAVPEIVPLLADRDAEVRAQAAKVLGEAKGAPAAQLVPLLKDGAARVRFFAALSLGRVGQRDAVAPVLEMLRANADADAYLRHAGVMALVGLADRKDLEAAASDAAPAVRLGALLAMRRRAMPEVARFLRDAEPKLVLEAACAIYDTPIPAALPDLAALANRRGLSAPVLRRVVNAHLRLGQRANADQVARLAARADVPATVRQEALQLLERWAKPAGRDRVVGLWRPLEARPQEDAAAALRTSLGGIFNGPPTVRAEAARVAARLGIQEVGPALMALLADRKQPSPVRVETLLGLEALKGKELRKAADLAVVDADPRLRAEGRRVLAALDPAGALALLEPALARGATVERQGALAVLGGLKQPGADALLVRWLDQLLAGKVPAEIRLDLLEAAERRRAKEVKERLARYEAARPRNDPVAKYLEALAGGDAANGRRIFLDRVEVSCLRCHKVNGQGGEVGPDLTGIGARQPRPYLLEALVVPNRQIAKGYETVVLTLTDGQVKSGILKSEDAKAVRLMTPEGVLLTVPKKEIDVRGRGPSAMPDDLTRHLTRSEVRDLVEFLATLK